LSGVLCYGRDFKGKLRGMRLNVLKIEGTVYRLKVKLLTHGRLPHPKEIEWAEETANNNFGSNGKRGGQGRNNNNSALEGNHHDEYEDSGLDL
jgi:hypothetical protein